MLILFLQGYAQKKWIKKLLSNEKDSTRSASFMPVPVFSYSQETGFEFGLGGIYSFYVDRGDKNNWSSNLVGAASYSTHKNYNFKAKTDVWARGNKYHWIGELRFKDLPFNFFGLGNNTAISDEVKLQQRLYKVSAEAEKRIGKHALSGLSLSYEDYRFKEIVPTSFFNASRPNVLGKAGGKVLFLGLSQSFDSRDANNYPTKGFYGRVSYQYAPNLFGNTQFSCSQLKLNLRSFWPLSSQVVLGWQGLFSTIQGKATPFYLMQQLGNDEMMRGYYTGRFRDENLFASQMELRYRFMGRFGIAAFAGLGKVFANGDAFFREMKPNYGIGGRYFFDPAKGLSVRLDYGIGEKRPNEVRNTGFYISFAEAF
jgi:outer membrane protein assembly factor BamA